MKEQEELADKQERVWRARRGYLHKQLDEGAGYMAAYVSAASCWWWHAVVYLLVAGIGVCHTVVQY